MEIKILRFASVWWAVRIKLNYYIFLVEVRCPYPLPNHNMLYVGRKCYNKHRGNYMGKYVGRFFGWHPESKKSLTAAWKKYEGAKLRCRKKSMRFLTAAWEKVRRLKFQQSSTYNKLIQGGRVLLPPCFLLYSDRRWVRVLGSHQYKTSTLNQGGGFTKQKEELHPISLFT